MKNRLLAAVALALVTAGPLGACAAQPRAGTPLEQSQQSAASRLDGPVGGYEGWWNATPTSGASVALPQETVAVNTETNQVVDAFNRGINDAGRPTKLSDVKYTVAPDPTWPDHSVVIIDTSTNLVIADFRVDAEGRPIR
ncbi:MAG: hypothetical protein NTU93_02325 [Arthrobacter sp.]|nr:hypothetical protein [Arthrobacter sp.]